MSERKVIGAGHEQGLFHKSFNVITARTHKVPEMQSPVELMSVAEWWRSGRLLPFKFHAPVEATEKPVKGTIRQRVVKILDPFPLPNALGGREQTARQQKTAVEVAQRSPGKKIG